MRDYSWVVLARSNVVHAPPRTPKSATAPAFVSRAHQLRALTEGRTLEPAGGRSRVLPPRMGGSPQAARTAVGRSQAGAPASMGSEARLLRGGSEPRLAQLGSEARLVRREPVHITFVIARSPGIPEPVAGALSGLAAAVWFGRDPVDVLAAGNALARTLADAGDLIRTRRRNPRPSRAGRSRARSRRPRHVSTRRSRLRGYCESRRLTYCYWPGRKFDHVHPRRGGSGYTIGSGCRWDASRVLALNADHLGVRTHGTGPEPDPRPSPGCCALLRPYGSPARRRQARSPVRRVRTPHDPDCSITTASPHGSEMTSHWRPRFDGSGHLVLFLHAHLPYVRDPEEENGLAETWFYEAVTGSGQGVGDSRIRSVAVLIAVATSVLGCSGSGRRRSPTAKLRTEVRARSARAVACRSLLRLRSTAARRVCRLSADHREGCRWRSPERS